MNFNDYTKDQQKAIISKGSNIIVSAGAGSGKTQVLTERVVHFVKNENYQMDEFLILTFTNLAAGEMKHRIRKALEQEKLAAASEVDTADICTFDSYALALVRKYHFMLKVSPNVSIIESNIIEVRKRTILEDIFEELYQQEDEIFLQMIKRFCFKDDVDLRNLLLDIYEKALLANDTISYLDSFIERYYNNELIERMIKEIFESLTKERTEFLKLVERLTKEPISKKDPRPFVEAVREILSNYIFAKDYDEIIISVPASLGIKKPSGISDSEDEVHKKFKDAYKKIYDGLKKLPNSTDEFKQSILSNVKYVEKLLEIIKELNQRITKYKDYYQVFEFGDIAKMALSLVKENDSIRNLIKNKLKMIMIDEYQDTSELQESFIKQIANNNVYMVGDVKQSIYRFRNAKCDIFINKYDNYKYQKAGMAIDLKKNFRSRKEVLDDINYIFKYLMTKDIGGAMYKEDHLIESGNQAYEKAGKKEESSHLDFLLYNDKKNKASEIEANLIARDIINKINSGYQVLGKNTDGQPILRPCKYSDFCILMDRGSTFDTYAKIFSEYKLPLFVENDENISKSELVLVLSNLLKLMKAVNNHDYISREFIKAFISVARSFLFNYSDDEIYHICREKTFYQDQIINDIREILYENSAYPLYKQFEQLVFKLDIYHKCINAGDVTKNEKYLDTFLNMFASMSALDYSLDDFILYLEYIDNYELKINLSSTGSNIDSVRIMNIHKSKGLEFSIVYFSGLYKKFNQMDLKKGFGISNEYGLILPPEDVTKIDVVKKLNASYEMKEDLSERIRLFYVALTRTKEKMIFVCNSDHAVPLYKEFNNQLFATYVDNNHLRTLPEKEQYTLTLNAYLNQEITSSVFLKICEEFNLIFPQEFLNLEYQEQLLYSKQSLIDYYEHLNDLLVDVVERYNDTDEVIIYFYRLLNQAMLSNEEFNYFLKKLNKTIKDEFYDLKSDFLTSEDIIEINPLIEYKINNEYQLKNGIIKYLEGEISKDILKKYLSLFNCTLNDEYISSIIMNDVEPKVNLQVAIVEHNNIYISSQDFISILKNQVFSIDEFSILYYLYHNKYPNQLEITTALANLGKNNQDFEAFVVIVNYLGYSLTKDGKQQLSCMTNGISNEEIISILDQPFNQYFTPNNELINLIDDNQSFSCEKLLKDLFDQFKNNVLTLDDFITLINVINFELDVDFNTLSIDEMKLIDSSMIDNIVVEKELPQDSLAKADSFDSLITPFINYRRFKKYVISLELKKQEVTIPQTTLNFEKLEVKPFNFNGKQIEIFRASKELNLSASKKNMDFGTKIHLIMEIMDFKTPNYNLINDHYYEEIVRQFLNSDLMKNIEQAEIYKEYEFFDEITLTKGIIDLMLVYSDHIDIIDYKTKNIDDASYDKQVLIYQRFIERLFSLPVNTYLYSLLTGDVKKCN